MGNLDKPPHKIDTL